MSDIALRLSRLGRRGAGEEGQLAGASVPGRIMAPRIIYIACSLGLLLFGLLMIYSASSIIGLTSKALGNDPTYYLVRQVGVGAGGLVLALVLARVDYHVWSGLPLRVVWVGTFLMLLLVYAPIAGQDAYGATRWISIGSFTLQPSEFAKVTIVLVGANIADEYFEKQAIDTREAIKLTALGVVLPLGLVLLQPDKGTTGVVLATLAVMVYLAGVPGRTIMVALGLGFAAAMVYALKDDYSRARIMTVFDPFSDQYGAGYQLVQGLYALGSGGLWGVGLGMSRQKYNYLPMAHNDFIFAVIGEELGFLGVVGLLAVFCLLLWAGLKIAENAPDLTGRLIAAGCTSLIIIQMLLNVSGVIGMFPLSGKPVPFISYGGSSILSTLMLVGLVISVSMRSTLPETRYDQRRAQMRIANGRETWLTSDDGQESFVLREGIEGSTAGRAMPRSARLARGDARRADSYASSRSSLRVVEGGSSATPSDQPSTSRSAKLAGRVSVDASGRKRIDLGPSAADRLRGRNSKR